MIKQDILENQVRSIYLGIGSNLGNKKDNIEKAKFELNQMNIKILQSSSYYESLSWPNPKNPKFLNIVLEVTTNLRPHKLLNKCKEIEVKLGRNKSVKNSPRTCDIDIISYRNKVIFDKIKIPHERMSERNFVLIPLFEIAPNFVHPKTNKSIKKLIFSLSIKDITSIKHI